MQIDTMAIKRGMVGKCSRTSARNIVWKDGNEMSGKLPKAHQSAIVRSSTLKWVLKSCQVVGRVTTAAFLQHLDRFLF